jgi:hypothetical protein
MAYNATKLLTMSHTELDDLFTSAKAGDIPTGEAEGTAIVAPGTPFTPEIAQIINIFAWQGKIFDAQKKALVNKITVFGIDAILARITRGPSWIDGKECIVLDYSQTSFVAHWIRDEIRLISPGLYLGILGQDPSYIFCAPILSRHAMLWTVVQAAGDRRVVYPVAGYPRVGAHVLIACLRLHSLQYI